jgi:hypothetical protein
MRQPSPIAIFVAGLALGVVLSMVILMRSMSADGALHVAGASSGPASKAAPANAASAAAAAAAAEEAGVSSTLRGEIRINPAMLQDLRSSRSGAEW